MYSVRYMYRCACTCTLYILCPPVHCYAYIFLHMTVMCIVVSYMYTAVHTCIQLSVQCCALRDWKAHIGGFHRGSFSCQPSNFPPPPLKKNCLKNALWNNTFIYMYFVCFKWHREAASPSRILTLRRKWNVFRNDLRPQPYSHLFNQVAPTLRELPPLSKIS